MGIVGTLQGIARHPLSKSNKVKALGRWAYWQLRSRIACSDQIYRWVGGILVSTRSGDRGFTGNIYNKLQDYEEMSLLLDYLREGDVFVDVGANIGAYSLLAAKICGARVVSYEPITQTYLRLKRNIELNKLGRLVVTKRLCLSDRSGDLRMSSDKNTQNSVITGKGEHQGDQDTECVQAITLDEELKEVEVTVLKIDVEGFEEQVLRGGKEVLSRESLRMIIIETCREVGEIEEGERIRRQISANGFRQVYYDPINKSLEENDQELLGKNSIFIRSKSEVERRVLQSEARVRLGLS